MREKGDTTLERMVRGFAGIVYAARAMGRRRKLYDRITSGGSDRNIPFEQARNLLLHLGFSERTRGSHHIFKRPEIPERVVLQPGSEGNLKPYQVRQVREVLIKYGLREEL